MLSQDQGQVLVQLARQTISSQLGLPVARPLDPARLADPALQAKQGVFVTLHKKGRLRGCIGSLEGVESLVDGVRRHAVNAAFHDHRFPPVTREEVPELDIEVSVLSEPRPLPYNEPEELLSRLRPGVDGVIIRAPGGASATFLPQVWEQLPDPRLFLAHLCLKAGLDEQAWRRGQLAVQTYQVQHFAESQA